jgi:putative effector of murein hydrolase LrgA (UPF0299 family)
VDSDWLRVITARSPFLFVSSWTQLDWFRGATTVALLAVAAQWQSDPAIRRVAWAAAMVGVGGVLAGWLGSDVVPVEIIVQAQPWRTLWLASVVSLLLVPATVLAAWQTSALGRSSAIFIVTAVCSLSPAAGSAAAIAALCCSLVRRDPSAALIRLVYVAAVLALAATIVTNSLGILDVLRVPLFGGSGDARLETARNVAAFIVPALAFIACIGYLTSFRPGPASIALAGCATAALALFVARPAVGEFKESAFAGAKHALFEDWRRLIPPGTNVLWPRTPMAAWFLLERPSYLSTSQLSGVVFSRALALESAARAAKLASYVSQSWIFADPDYSGEGVRALTLPILRDVCTVPEIGFVVATEKVTESAPWHAWPDSSHRVYLYDCREFR